MPAGTFVLSLDTEIAWGNCWNGTVQRYARHYNAYRGLITRLVQLLDDHHIPATWAFVGHLLLDACDGAHADVLRPNYPWFNGDWLSWDPGTNLQADPWWYGRDVLEMVRQARASHEIGTHTFSHLIVGDPACTAAVFRSELAKCVALHREAGLPALRSIVFPNNLIAHLGILTEYGIIAYRGREEGWHASAPPRLQRPTALVYRALPFRPPVYDMQQRARDGLVNVPASMVLLAYDGIRRYLPNLSRYLPAGRGLRAAARQGLVFHLYFHPYNLASSPLMFTVLEAILRQVNRWRAQGLLRVATMGQLAEEVLAGG